MCKAHSAVDRILVYVMAAPDKNAEVHRQCL